MQMTSLMQHYLLVCPKRCNLDIVSKLIFFWLRVVVRLPPNTERSEVLLNLKTMQPGVRAPGDMIADANGKSQYLFILVAYVKTCKELFMDVMFKL